MDRIKKLQAAVGQTSAAGTSPTSPVSTAPSTAAFPGDVGDIFLVHPCLTCMMFDYIS